MMYTMLRQLLVLSFIICMLSVPTESAAQADVVLHNARIYTVDDEQPRAEALAVREGRFLMVGSDEAILAAYPDASRVDARGRTVIPGLIDAHAHFTGLAETFLTADLVGTSSREEIMARLREFAQTLPAGAWLQGRGWDQNDWSETAFPTRASLDEAFPDRPVWLVRIDGHAGWANTAAMEAARPQGFADVSDPEGGHIVRNEQGTATGIFVDEAMSLVANALPQASTAEMRGAVRRALEETRRNGLTGLHDAGVSLGTLDMYRSMIDEENFGLRVYAMVSGRGATFDHFCEEGPLIDYGGRLTVRSVKYYMDGALGSRGAALLDDYSDDPGNRGLLRHLPDTFYQNVRRAMECGFQVNTHAIGDRANRIVLDAYARALRESGHTTGRHRIEHAQILAPSDIARFAEIDVIASMQPTHATSDMYWADERLGEARLQGAYAWKSLLDSGARLAFGSDFPVEQVNPLLGFHAAVTRQDAQGRPDGGWQPQERISRREALHAFTLGAAYAAFQENEVGSITPGKKADFLMLSADIMDVPARQILDTEVVATYLGGERIFHARGADTRSGAPKN